MKKVYYAVIDVTRKNKKGDTETKSYIYEYEGLRRRALSELEHTAKGLRGKITHFGAF